MLKFLHQPVSIAPLSTFRAVFGGIMFWSILRFWSKGWIEELYILPNMYFPFVEGIEPLPGVGMYLVFAGMAVSALGICFGFLYRVMAPLFFLLFTYVELLDKTNYLNHYYFVSIVAFLLSLVPAHRSFSLDVRWGLVKPMEKIPKWMLGAFRLQMGMVYFFAGVAKLNADWLLRAMPLKVWLPAKSNLPVIGGLLKLKWVAYVFSWGGAIYDLFVAFLLAWKKTRLLAYGAVVGFHLMTWWLFPIGMFPFIMIFSTLIFFSGEWHLRLQNEIESRFPKKQSRIHCKVTTAEEGLRCDCPDPDVLCLKGGRLIASILLLHFGLQVALPFRYLLYPGKLFWTEQGFRFSWRVMLIEKAGTAFFYVQDRVTGGESEVDNSVHLTPNQEKMMATQPDMILQYAHFLKREYESRGMENPKVRAEIYVTLNGSGSRPFIDSQVDLGAEKHSCKHKNWILPFE